MTRYQSAIVKSGIASAVAKGVQTVSAIITVPQMLGYFGPHGYGLFVTAGTVAAYFAPADLGAGAATVDRVANADSTVQAVPAVAHAAGISAVVSMALGIVGVVAVALGAGLHVIDGSSRESVFVMCVAVALALTSVPVTVMQKLAFGRSEDYWNQLAYIAAAICGIGVVILCCHLRMSLILTVGLLGLGNVVVNLAMVIVYCRMRGVAVPITFLFNIEYVRALLRDGRGYWIIHVLSLFVQCSDVMIVAAFADSATVAQYYVYLRVFMLAQLAQYFVAPFWPVFARRQGGTRAPEVPLIECTCIMFTAGAVASVAVLLLIRQGLLLWVGDTIAYEWSLSTAFALASPIMVASGVASMYMLAAHRMRSNIPLYFVATIVSLIVRLLGCRLGGLPWLVLAGAISWMLVYTLPVLWLSRQTRWEAYLQSPQSKGI